MSGSYRLLCDECGEPFTDIREEEMDPPHGKMVEYTCENGHTGREVFRRNGFRHIETNIRYEILEATPQ